MSYTRLLSASYQDDSLGTLTKSVIGSVDNIKEFRLNSYFIKGDKVFFDGDYFNTSVGLQLKGTTIKICKITHFADSFNKGNWQELTTSTDAALESNIEYAHNDLKTYPISGVSIPENNGYNIPLGRTLKLNPDTDYNLLLFHQSSMINTINNSSPYTSYYNTYSTHFNESFYDGLQRGILSVEYMLDGTSRLTTNILLSGIYIIEKDSSVGDLVVYKRKLLEEADTEINPIEGTTNEFLLDDEFLIISPWDINENSQTNDKIQIYKKGYSFTPAKSYESIYHTSNMMTPNGSITTMINAGKIYINNIMLTTATFGYDRTENGFDYYTGGWDTSWSDDLTKLIGLKIPAVHISRAENDYNDIQDNIIFLSEYLHSKQNILPDSEMSIVYKTGNYFTFVRKETREKMSDPILSLRFIPSTIIEENEIPFGYRALTETPINPDPLIPNNYPSITEIKNRNLNDSLVEVFPWARLIPQQIGIPVGVEHIKYTWSYNDALYMLIGANVYVYDLKSGRWLPGNKQISQDMHSITMSDKGKKSVRQNGLVYFLRWVNTPGIFQAIDIAIFDSATNEFLYGETNSIPDMNYEDPLLDDDRAGQHVFEHTEFFGNRLFAYSPGFNQILIYDFPDDDISLSQDFFENRVLINLPTSINGVAIPDYTRCSIFVDCDSYDDAGNPIPSRLIFSAYPTGLTNGASLMSYIDLYNLSNPSWTDIVFDNPNNLTFSLDFMQDSVLENRKYYMMAYNNDGTIYDTPMMMVIDYVSSGGGEFAIFELDFSTARLESSYITSVPSYAYTFTNQFLKYQNYDVLKNNIFIIYNDQISTFVMNDENIEPTTIPHGIGAQNIEANNHKYIRYASLSIDNDTMVGVKSLELETRINNSKVSADRIDGIVSANNISDDVWKKSGVAYPSTIIGFPPIIRNVGMEGLARVFGYGNELNLFSSDDSTVGITITGDIMAFPFITPKNIRLRINGINNFVSLTADSDGRPILSYSTNQSSDLGVYDNHIVSAGWVREEVPTLLPKEFDGTQAQWDAIPADEKLTYKTIYIHE